MYVSTRRLVLAALVSLLVPACFEPSAVPGDARLGDTGPDQAQADTLVRDGPGGEGKKPDGPLADFGPADMKKPEGPLLDLFPVSGPDAAVCTAAKTVWGGFKWNECPWL